MSGPRRCGSRRPAVVGDNSNGYVETDPTGRYGRLDELLGKGAMKSMYRGFDEERGVEVAWNQAYLSDVLRTPDAVERMYSEVQLLSTLRHDAVISFHASWVDVARRTFNFITELFSSRTLRSYRLRYPRLSLRARSTRRSRLASCPKPSTASRDDDARRFIGRCLVAASRRPSAAELLTDPFLLDDHHHHSNKSVSDAVTMPPSSSLPVGAPCSSTCSSTCNVEEAADQPHAPIRTDMTITGKLNAEEDTIFLKVQIADQTADAGNNVRNIYFPFDIASDTAMEVAEEMVKELEITDREPSEIAAMIEQEIERLLPGRQQQHEYSVHVANGDDDDDENEERSPLFYYLSSSPTSSHGSLCGGVRPHDSGGYSGPHGGGWSKGEHKLV